MRRLRFIEKNSTSHDGLPLYYEVTGDKKRTLMFLHGLGGDVAAWDEIRTFFDHIGYSTIALDLRGHGFSGHPEKKDGFGIDHMARDVKDILEAENVKKCALIGHCFGGLVAYTFAELFPNYLQGLILISVGARQPYILGYEPIKKATHALVRTVAPYGFRHHTPSHADYSLGKYEHDFEPLGLFRVIKHNSLRSYLHLTDEVFSFGSLETFHPLPMPTLLLAGTNDSVYPPKGIEAVHKHLNGSELVYIEGANHPTVLNRPMEVSFAIQEFLQKNKFQ